MRHRLKARVVQPRHGLTNDRTGRTGRALAKGAHQVVKPRCKIAQLPKLAQLPGRRPGTAQAKYATHYQLHHGLQHQGTEKPFQILRRILAAAHDVVGQGVANGFRGALPVFGGLFGGFGVGQACGIAIHNLQQLFAGGDFALNGGDFLCTGTTGLGLGQRFSQAGQAQLLQRLGLADVAGRGQLTGLHFFAQLGHLLFYRLRLLVALGGGLDRQDGGFGQGLLLNAGDFCAVFGNLALGLQAFSLALGLAG